MLKPKELVVAWARWLEERCIGRLHRLCAGARRSWSGRGGLEATCAEENYKRNGLELRANGRLGLVRDLRGLAPADRRVQGGSRKQLFQEARLGKSGGCVNSVNV